MYNKRRKRRASAAVPSAAASGIKKRGKQKPSIPQGDDTNQAIIVDTIPTEEEVSEANVDNMKDTTVEAVEDEQIVSEMSPVPTLDNNIISSTTNNNSKIMPGQDQNKAVGARRRKPTQISKIVETPHHNNNGITPSSDNEEEVEEEMDNEDIEMMEMESGSESTEDDNNDASYNEQLDSSSPNHKNRNGMIQSIVTELKSAKVIASNSQLKVDQTVAALEKKDVKSELQQQNLNLSDHQQDEDEDVDDDEGNDLANKDNDDVLKKGGGGGARLRKRLRSDTTAAVQRKGRKSKKITKSEQLKRAQENKKNNKSSSSLLNIPNPKSKGAGLKSSKQVKEDEDDSYSSDGVDMKNAGIKVCNSDDEHSCALCPYTCPDKSTLLRHMRKHSGERPFQCRLCSFGFTTKANCERHLRNRHGQIDKGQLRNLIDCHLTSNDGSSNNDGDSSDENESTPKSFTSKQVIGTSGQMNSANFCTTNNNAILEKLRLSYNNGPLNGNGLFSPAANPMFIPTSSSISSEFHDFKNSPPSFMLNPNMHPLFLSSTAGVDLSGITIANAHCNNNIKRNLFMDSMSLGQLFGGGGRDYSMSRPQEQASALPLVTNHDTDNGPLDLSMDAVDLTVKRGSSKNGSLLKTLPKPKPMYPIDSFSQGLVTSPFISKREPMVHPQLPIPNFSAHNALHSADLSLSNGLGSSTPSGVPFPLFPFGTPNLTSGNFPFGIRPPTSMDKYMGLGSTGSAPSKISIPFLASSSPPLTATSFGERTPEMGMDETNHDEVAARLDATRQASYKSSSNSPNPVSSSRHYKRSDKRRGADYQKPKQRRYRTERPFSCPHCPAKFTLRSNMERHGKHQHPTVWQRSPSNRVINRQKNLASQQSQSPLLTSPTLVPTNKYSSMNGFDYSSKLAPMKKSNEAQVNSVNVRAVIAQQLKRKISTNNLKLSRKIEQARNGAENSEDDSESKIGSYVHENGSGGIPDLASVSQLLNRAKTSNFPQFFNESVESGSIGSNHNNSINHPCSSLEGDNGGGGSESDSDNNNATTSEEEEEEEEEDENENKRFKLNNGEKKKSAYSSAPHKISCPHCTRRFPWTSSLRRHLLTHTGQKPYQCTKCPLLFTTKSNCDRHLVRKHNGNRTNNNNESGNKKSKKGRRRKTKRNLNSRCSSNNASSIADEHEVDGESSLDDEGVVDDDVEDEIHQNESNAQDGEGSESPAFIPEPANKKQLKQSKVASTEPPSGTTPVNTKNVNASLSSTGSSPGEDVAFRCHLCDASAVERDILLSHMEEDHKDTFLLLLAKGALVNSPPSPSENSESDLTNVGATTTPPTVDQKDVTHRKVMCVFCVRRFWSVEDLRRHIRSHSGERPFSCPYCSRRFTLKHSMLRHIKKHDSSNNNNDPTPTNKSSCNKRIKKQLNVDKNFSTTSNSGLNRKSDLIGKLLGINDERLVEELLSKSDARDAAEFLGLGLGDGISPPPAPTFNNTIVSSSTN